MPDATRRRIKSPCYIRLADLKELARLVCALERAPYPVFSLQSKDSPVLATQVDVFIGTPIFYFAKASILGHFLGYRNTNGIEEAVVTDSVSNPGLAYAPIISVKKLPELFEKTLNTPQKSVDRFQAVQVHDLASIARVSSYKMIFEEPPIPLFLFQQDQNWVLGAFTHIDEYEEASMFFYALLETQPNGSFLRYSPTKAGEASFTNRIDEHGYVYIKTIKLVEAHPMVRI